MTTAMPMLLLILCCLVCGKRGSKLQELHNHHRRHHDQHHIVLYPHNTHTLTSPITLAYITKNYDEIMLVLLILFLYDRELCVLCLVPIHMSVCHAKPADKLAGCCGSVKALHV